VGLASGGRAVFELPSDEDEDGYTDEDID